MTFPAYNQKIICREMQTQKDETIRWWRRVRRNTRVESEGHVKLFKFECLCWRLPRLTLRHECRSSFVTKLFAPARACATTSSVVQFSQSTMSTTTRATRHTSSILTSSNTSWQGSRDRDRYLHAAFVIRPIPMRPTSRVLRLLVLVVLLLNRPRVQKQ